MILWVSIFIFILGCAKNEGDSSSKIQCLSGEDTYEVGESFKSSDNCNTCRCMDSGDVACTTLACADSTCQVGDEVYSTGDTFKVECNTCTCSDNGAVSCTEMDCGV
jgi:hypothetical protein